MMKGAGSRPQGITILAVLSGIGGVFGILGGLGILALGGLAGAIGVAAGAYGALGGIIFLYGLLLLAISAAECAMAYGFWMLKSWAYQFGLYVQYANIGLAVLGVLLWGQGIFGAVITAAISGAIIYYLRMPEVKAAFDSK
jgi:hypothetical protein